MAKKYFNVDVETSGDVTAVDVTASGSIAAMAGSVSALALTATGSGASILTSGAVTAASVVTTKLEEQTSAGLEVQGDLTCNVQGDDIKMAVRLHSDTHPTQTRLGAFTIEKVDADPNSNNPHKEMVRVQDYIFSGSDESEINLGHARWISAIANDGGSVGLTANLSDATSQYIQVSGDQEKIKIVSPSIEFTGPVEVDGATTLTGAVGVTGDITLTGALDVSDASITADAVFKVKVDDTSNSSELHLTPQYLKLAVADPQSQSSFSVNSSSGNVLTAGTATTYGKLTVNDEAEVTGKLTVNDEAEVTGHLVVGANLTAGGILTVAGLQLTNQSIQDPDEDAPLIAFDGYDIKLPQLAAETGSQMMTETYDVVVHVGGTGAKELYRRTTTAFTGSHNHIGSDVVGLGVGDVVGLDNGRLVHVGPNSTVAVGIIAYVSKDAVIRTSLGETELPEGHKIYCTASVGDSRHKGCQGFNICNEAGDISPGDLLVTSSTPGYLMKQDDDIIRSKTVGKAMEAVTFDANGQATGIYGYIYCG